MESYSNKENVNSNNDVKDDRVLGEKARKMVIESLKVTLKNRENNSNLDLPEDYYSEVEKALRENGEF